MSSYCTLHRFLLLLISSSLVPVSGTWCNRYSSSSDCGYNQVCCRNFCFSRSDCLNDLCTSDDDCSITEICCSNKCKNSLDCSGYNCATDSNCGSKGLSCCDGTCHLECSQVVYNVPAIVIVGALLGVFLFISGVSISIYCFCRRRQTRPGGVITATTVTNTRQVPQLNTIYPEGQVPPSYHQGYPYHPHPQFERPQLQTTSPPHYNPDAIRLSEEPPPAYNEVVQGSSGTANTPQTYYGAAPTPSAPPPQ